MGILLPLFWTQCWCLTHGSASHVDPLLKCFLTCSDPQIHLWCHTRGDYLEPLQSTYRCRSCVTQALVGVWSHDCSFHKQHSAADHSATSESTCLTLFVGYIVRALPWHRVTKLIPKINCENFPSKIYNKILFYNGMGKTSFVHVIWLVCHPSHQLH